MNGLAHNQLPSQPPAAVEVSRENSRKPSTQFPSMDPHQHRRCKWDGCRSYEVALEGAYCQEHKRQYHQAHPPQLAGTRVFLGSSSGPALDPISAFKNRGSGNGSLNSVSFPGPPSPQNGKKQLPDKHTARKSAKQPPITGQSNMSYVRRPSIDALPANPRPAKRQRLAGMPNVPELCSRSDSPPFSENGIPQPSTRGMFRQPEERTYKLSAVDDFALRPKKKETTTESVKPKAHTDQRSPHRGEGHRNNSSRQTPPSSKPPPNTNSDGNNRPGSFAIGTMMVNGLEPLPDPQRPAFTRPRVPNGIVDSHHKSRMPSEGTLDLPHGKKDVALDERRRWEESRQRQPDGAPQPQQRLVVDQGSRDLHVQDSPQNIASSAPSIKPNLNAAQGVSFQPPPPNRQTPNIPNFSKPLGPARMDSTYQQSIPPTRGHQLLNGARQLPPDRKISTPIGSNRGPSETEGIMTKEPTEPAAPQPQIAGIIPHPLSGTQPSAPSVEHLPVPEKFGQPPTPMNSQGPLSALLGGRKWGKMSPEERRLFWVSQHDPTEFDNQIYSENNRPFRPGDALFGVVDNIRPTRLATHFAYIDPRTHYSRQYPDQWYQRKQEEILARGNRKVELGETIKRAVRRRQSASNSDPQQNTLPQYVRNNPTWLAAVKVLDGFASQAKNKDINTHRQEDTHKGKAKQTTDVERDSDADIESS